MAVPQKIPREHKVQKKCFRCDKTYTPTGSNQKFCPACRPLAKRDRYLDYQVRASRRG